MKLYLSLLICLAFCGINAADCHDHGAHDHSEHAEEHNHENEHEEEERGILLSDNAMKALRISFAKVEKRQIGKTKSVYARAMVAPWNIKRIAAPVAGTILYRKNFTERIAAGETVIEITSPKLAVKYHELQALRERMAKIDSLGVKNAALSTEIKIAELTLQSLTNTLTVADAKSGRYLIVAKRGGTVNGNYPYGDGSFVERGAVLMEIADDSHLDLMALLPATDTAAMSNAMKIVTSRGDRGVLSLDRSREDGLAAVWGIIAKPASKIVRGECIKMDIFLDDDTSKANLAIPEKCVFKDGIENAVLCRDKNNSHKVVLRHVETGTEDKDWVEVRNLEEGEEVVEDGVYELKMALPGAGEKRKAGHFHADGQFHAGEDGE